METMPTKITLTSKYANVLPQGGGPEEVAKNLGKLLGKECFS
jgi:hypothetical protein